MPSAARPLTLTATLVAACLVSGTVAARQQGAGAGAANARTAIITGQIVDDATGSPVSGAVVAISASSGVGRRSAQLDRIRTDAAGRFFFLDVAPGSYQLTVTKAGWLNGSHGRRWPDGPSSPLTVDENARLSNITIPMWRPAVIGGRVTDENGEPIVNADIRAMRVEWIAGHQHASIASRQKTDDRGMFRFGDLLPGRYAVMLIAAVMSEPAEMASVTGSALDPYLATMAGIATPSMSLPLSRSTRADLRTDSDRWLLSSLFEHPGIPAADGSWTTFPTTFHSSSASLASATIVRAESGVEQIANVTARSTPMFQVSGTVVGPDGPAAFHTVHLFHADAPDLPVFDVAASVTDRTGAFRMFGVPAGQYVARVVRVPPPGGDASFSVIGGTGAVQSVGIVLGSRPTGALPVSSEPLWYSSRTVSVGDRDVTDLTLRLQPGARVSGRAEFVGNAPRPTPEQLRSMSVLLLPANGRQDANYLPGPFSDDGRFTTSSVMPGKYLLHLSGQLAGWRLARATSRARNISDVPVELTEDLNDVVITFVDTTFTLSGTVTFPPATGAVSRTIPVARVLIFPVDQSLWTDFGRGSRVVTSVAVSRTGEYSLPLPPPGEYFLVAVPDGAASDWQQPGWLAKIAAVADRIQVTDGANVTQRLTLREAR